MIGKLRENNESRLGGVLNSVDRLIMSAIVLAAIVNVASSYYSEVLPESIKVSALLIVSIIFIYFIFRILGLLLSYLRYGRFAVLVFVLNKKNQLLLVSHPYHKRRIPPGGRLAQWELPHTAVTAKLKDEANILNFEFHSLFHKKHLVISELVEDVPRPYSVHMEHRRQRSLVKFHYAFIYIVRCLEEGGYRFRSEYDPKWFSLQEIKEMPRDQIPFDDIIRRYEDILEQLNG